MLELWGMRSTPSLPSLPGPFWPWVVTPEKALSMGQIEPNCILMLNWIVWNRTVFWNWNCVFMLNWIAWNKTFLTFNLVNKKTILILIVWNRTVNMYKIDLAFIIYNRWCNTKPNQTKPNQPPKPNSESLPYRFINFRIQNLILYWS